MGNTPLHERSRKILVVSLRWMGICGLSGTQERCRPKALMERARAILNKRDGIARYFRGRGLETLAEGLGFDPIPLKASTSRPLAFKEQGDECG